MRPWKGLEIPIHPNATALFSMAVCSEVGNGNNTLFWSDKWMRGCRVTDLSPSLITAVPEKIKSKRLVAEALERITDGLMTFKEIYQSSGCMSFLIFVMLSRKSLYPIMRADIFGSSLAQEPILPNQLTWSFFKGLGELGLQLSSITIVKILRPFRI